MEVPPHPEDWLSQSFEQPAGFLLLASPVFASGISIQPIQLCLALVFLQIHNTINWICKYYLNYWTPKSGFQWEFPGGKPWFFFPSSSLFIHQMLFLWDGVLLCSSHLSRTFHLPALAFQVLGSETHSHCRSLTVFPGCLLGIPGRLPGTLCIQSAVGQISSAFSSLTSICTTMAFSCPI